VRPASTADFFRLAAEQIRRELLDLARFHRRRPTINHPLDGGKLDVPDHNAPDERDLDRWQALHERVEQLPVDLREVFSLTFYHGRTQAEIAEVLRTSERQVRRLWRDACLRLDELLAGDLPFS
jgi:RNA polymerase sigma-70 factor (ECF subfamily)